MKTFEPMLGQHIDDAIRQAIDQAGDELPDRSTT